MRDPLLHNSIYYTADYSVAPNVHDKRDEDQESTTIIVQNDMQVKEATRSNVRESPNLRWVADVDVDSKDIQFKIDKFPSDVQFSDLRERIISHLGMSPSGMDDGKVELSDRTFNPVIDNTFLLDILDSMGYTTEVTDTDVTVAEKSKIGRIEISTNSIGFSEEFQYEKFISEMREHIISQTESIVDLDNPYEKLFQIEDLSPFFLKYGEKAIDFWVTYADRLFTHNPLTETDGCLEQLVNSREDVYDHLVLWTDLMQNIQFEMVELSDERTVDIYRSTVADMIDVSESNVTFPWLLEEFSWVLDNLVHDYTFEDFRYNELHLTTGTEIAIQDDDMSMIYRTVRYGKCNDLNGSLIPDGWIAEKVAVTSNTVGDRDELYTRLQSAQDYRYLTKDEIESCATCTDSDLNPVVKIDGEYAEKYEQIKKKEEYENRIRKSVENGYKIDKISLSDLVEFEEWSGGYPGWHTGTLCSEFPIKVSIDNGKSYHAYGEFNDDGVVSYKSSENIHIKPNWEKINPDIDPTNSTTADLRSILSDYSVEDTVTITFHDLP